MRQSLFAPSARPHDRSSAIALASLAALLLVGGLTPIPAAAQQARRAGADRGPIQVKITAALVTADLTVKPVPLAAFDLVNAEDTSAVVHVRTGLDGTATATLAAGRYQVRNLQPVTVGDSTYRWDLTAELRTAGQSLELTNANAVVAAAGPRVEARMVAPERGVFEQVRRGVFRIEAGLASGSGFLIADHGGLVVTNDHVVANSTTASVYLDSVTRVPAARLEGRPRLPLAAPSAGDGLVVAGERILAIGFPLHQEMTLTTGIASSVRDGAIISDVNLNHGNSGGPMLNLAGAVVGVNTFGDMSEQGGPGIAGAIAITRLTPLLGRIDSALAKLPALADSALPVMPEAVYPSPLIKATADTIDFKHYRKLVARGAGNFTVTLTTPVMLRALQMKEAAEVGGDRRKREERAGVAADERFSELGTSHDWERYVGAETAPVVTVRIEPKMGETFWSGFGRALEASQYGVALSAAKMKFNGDVRGVRFYRNGVEITPLRGGHGPFPVMVDNRWVVMKDVADYGYYVLPPEAFAPDSTGAPARVFIAIQDLKHTDAMSAVEISGDESAQVWNDFLAYFKATGQSVRPSDRQVKAPKVKMSCEPQTGVCHPGTPFGYYGASY